MEWKDLRILLAVAQAGSVVGAGRELGMAHTTVSRRLAALEQSIPLFERADGALVATPQGEEMLERARAVEAAMSELDRRIASLSGRLEGTVRIATNLLWAELLMPALGQLRQRAPGLTLHIQVSNSLVDLSRHEADLAVRLTPPGKPPAWSNVVARKLAALGFALFGSASYFARRGERVRPIGDLAGHDVIGFGANCPWQPGAALLAVAGDGARCVMATNNLHGVVEAAAAGFGLAIVPCFLGEARGLIQLGPPIDHGDAFVAFAADMQDVPRVRLVIDTIVELVRADAPRIRGSWP